jgi:hypothetical protein
VVLRVVNINHKGWKKLLIMAITKNHRIRCLELARIHDLLKVGFGCMTLCWLRIERYIYQLYRNSKLLVCAINVLSYTMLTLLHSNWSVCSLEQLAS